MEGGIRPAPGTEAPTGENMCSAVLKSGGGGEVEYVPVGVEGRESVIVRPAPEEEKKKNFIRSREKGGSHR